MVVCVVSLVKMASKASGYWSSASKLRAQFVSPIYHLLATVIYSQVPNGVRIDHLRLDFLEPTTPVSVRLEASVNHRILANGTHHSRVI